MHACDQQSHLHITAVSMNYVPYTMHYTKVFVGVIQHIQASLSCIQYAVWDLAFHMIPFARIDPEFAKKQLELFLSEKYMAPNGQIPGKNQQYNCHIARAFCSHAHAIIGQGIVISDTSH